MTNPKPNRQKSRDKDAAPSWGPALIGLVAVGVISLYVYRGVTDIRVSSPKWDVTVHKQFPGLEEAQTLSQKQRDHVIEIANHQPCPCGCVHTLASCLKSDLTCPIRAQNLVKIQELISDAAKRPAN